MLLNDYEEICCAWPGCSAKVSVPPWFKRFANYCDQHREDMKDEARQDEILDRQAEDREAEFSDMGNQAW